MSLSREEILRNIHHVKARIQIAAQSAGRDPDDIRLVAVTKMQPVEVIRSIPEGEIHILGENYVGDIRQKQEELGEAAALFEWHLIGTLQSRKVKHIPSHFSCMHSLDRLSIATKLNQAFEKHELRLPVFLQINIANEPSKSGWRLEVDKPSNETMAEIDEVVHLPNLAVQGLMCMPPYSENPENSRVHFVAMRKVQALFVNHFPDCQFLELSMGTSFDFEVAIQEGATYVRIGESIFGKREMNV